jgi:hypothetical protein
VQAVVIAIGAASAATATTQAARRRGRMGTVIGSPKPRLPPFREVAMTGRGK